jgi:hypothetical protein
MKETIAQLSDEQAIRSVRYFYDLSPSDVWEGRRKPSAERVTAIATALQANAPPDLKPILDGLLGTDRGGDNLAQAAACRALLDQLSQSPSFAPYVDGAVRRGRDAHMAIDPLTGAIMIALLVAMPRIQGKSDGSWVVDPAAGIPAVISALKLPELLSKLPAALRALPEGLLKELLRFKGSS